MTSANDELGLTCTGEAGSVTEESESSGSRIGPSPC